MNTNLPQSKRERTAEEAWLVKNALELARQHKQFCPAMLANERCDVDLRSLQILLRKAGVELTVDEEKELLS